MKIAQVAFRFDAPGGVETNVREVTRRLRGRGQEVAVFTSDLYNEPRWERRNNFAPAVEGVPVFRFPVYKRLIPGLTLPLLPGLMDALVAWKPDVIHAHSHRYGNVLEAAAVARATGTPLAVSLHYHPADAEEPAWKAGLLRVQDFGFGASAYRVARALIVESQFEADLVSGFAPKDRTQIIPPGIDLQAWATVKGARPAGLPDRYILFAGRIARNKGLPTLVEALAQLAPEKRLPLVIMGRDWGERAQVEQLAARLGIAQSLHWLEYVEELDAYRSVFEGASLFALPSQYEAFGLVLLEAMAARVPIVASRVGGVPEVLDGGRCGRLEPYGDARAWRNALDELLTNSAVAEGYATAGQAWVKGFDWDRSVDRLEKLYQDLTDGSGPAGRAA